MKTDQDRAAECPLSRKADIKRADPMSAFDPTRTSATSNPITF